MVDFNLALLEESLLVDIVFLIVIYRLVEKYIFNGLFQFRLKINLINLVNLDGS